MSDDISQEEQRQNQARAFKLINKALEQIYSTVPFVDVARQQFEGAPHAQDCTHNAATRLAEAIYWLEQAQSEEGVQ